MGREPQKDTHHRQTQAYIIHCMKHNPPSLCSSAWESLWYGRDTDTDRKRCLFIWGEGGGGGEIQRQKLKALPHKIHHPRPRHQATQKKSLPQPFSSSPMHGYLCVSVLDIDKHMWARAPSLHEAKKEKQKMPYTSL